MLVTFSNLIVICSYVPTVLGGTNKEYPITTDTCAGQHPYGVIQRLDLDTGGLLVYPLPISTLSHAKSVDIYLHVLMHE